MISGRLTSISGLGIRASVIYKWCLRYRVDEESQTLHPSAEREAEAEIRRLKRELEIIRQERDILGRALQIFSQDARRLARARLWTLWRGVVHLFHAPPCRAPREFMVYDLQLFPQIACGE